MTVPVIARQAVVPVVLSFNREVPATKVAPSIGAYIGTGFLVAGVVKESNFYKFGENIEI